MEPEIQALLEEVPADFAPTFKAKQEGERIVGTLDDLDDDTRRAVVGALYFLERGRAVILAHTAEHEQPGFEENGEACGKYSLAIEELQERVTTLQEATGPALQNILYFEPGEEIDFRIEGIVACPPEPVDPLIEMLRSLRARGVNVRVIGPGGIIVS